MVAIQPANFYALPGIPTLTAPVLAGLREDGYAIVDGWMPSDTVAAVRAALEAELRGAFRPTGQRATTRTDRIAWLNEGGVFRAPPGSAGLAPALEEAVLSLKGLAWELQGELRSGGEVEQLDVPRNVMASVYEGPPPSSASSSSMSSSSPSSPSVGYRPHRDHAPPSDDDMFWCWKSDREQSERRITAIVYINPWGEGWEEEGGGEGNRNGGGLRIFVGADKGDDDGGTAREVVDVAPAGGRLVLFDSRSTLHAVEPVTRPGARRFALSCWVLSGPGSMSGSGSAAAPYAAAPPRDA